MRATGGLKQEEIAEYFETHGGDTYEYSRRGLVKGCLIQIAELPGDWCRRGESNPRPRDYETLALPLSYAGVRQLFMLRTRLRMCQGIVLGCPLPKSLAEW